MILSLQMRTFLYIVLIALTLPHDTNGQSKHEDVILQAMQDELDRNMKELRLPDHDKPFFIMYNVQDQNS